MSTSLTTVTIGWERPVRKRMSAFHSICFSDHPRIALSPDRYGIDKERWFLVCAIGIDRSESPHPKIDIGETIANLSLLEFTYRNSFAQFWVKYTQIRIHTREKPELTVCL